MSWETSKRRSRLPENWAEIRREVLEDAGWVCEIRMQDWCLGTASEVDHILAGDDHSRENLQAVCYTCHLKKSALEGVAARRRKKAQKKRPPERHPGYR